MQFTIINKQKENVQILTFESWNSNIFDILIIW